jgi:hypothetical protein
MKYEVIYAHGHVEIVDVETMNSILEKLEAFKRWDVCLIYELKEDGSINKTIWTEEEGLFVLL